jgi:TPP-dependent pyruvate/acetoin dehydrogenase alpha subunit
MSTPVSQALPIADIADRARSYGFGGEVVDGNDLLAVRRSVAAACLKARRMEGPTLIECKTYRLSGHSRGDPRRYRTPDEEAAWLKMDPLKRFGAELRRRGILDRAGDAVVKRDARRIVAAAVRYARHSRYPDPGSVGLGVYA